MLYEWAAHGTRVCSPAVVYIGWKAEGSTLHVLAFGANTTCPKPLAMLAVIEPDVPCVRSLMTTWNPAGVSCKATVRVSPEFMNRSLVGSGVVTAGFVTNEIGLAGACATPFFVMNPKFTVSSPTVFRQAALLGTPVFWFRPSLSILSARTTAWRRS